MDIVRAFVRHVLTACGGAGVVGLEDDAMQFVSLVVAAVGLGWSIWEKVRGVRSGAGETVGNPVPLLFFLLLPVAMLCGGCNTISGTRTLSDGSTLTIKANRFLWMSEGIDFSALSEQDGSLVTELKVDKSGGDDDMLKAIAAGVAAGMKAAAGAP